MSSVSGGGRAYLRNISKLLANHFETEARHEIAFLAHREQADLLRGLEPSYVIWVSGNRRDGFSRLWGEHRNLPRIVGERCIDVVFTPYQVAPLPRGTRNVLMIRNMEPFLFRGYSYSPRTWLRNMVLARMSSACLRGADRVIAVSQFAADHLRNNLCVPSDRIRTIYHGSPSLQVFSDDAQHANLLCRIGVESNFILTCGSMLPYRRCEDVIQAFNACLSSLPDDMRLVIAGSGADAGYAKTIRQAIASSPDPQRIVATGNVPWEIIVALYRNCTACIIATEIEACPNIALEAMASECCIVSSDRPPLPEIFSDCVLGYESRNVKQLADQIIRVVRDTALCSNLKSRALQRAEAYSWLDCAQKTYSALVEW